MPFTFAHAAAALPFRRTRLVLSAMVIGCFVPDFKYLVNSLPGHHFGHTWRGALVLDLPIAFVVFWLFEYLIKNPGIDLLPDELRLRLVNRTENYSIVNPLRFLLVLVSLAVGIASHIAWDSFTHPRSWFYRNWPLLSVEVHLAPHYTRPVYKLLQNGSTVLGAFLVLAWMAWWFQKTPPDANGRPAPRRQPEWILASMVILAGLISLVRGVAASHGSRKDLLLVAGFSFVLILWWELLAWGLFPSHHPPKQSAAT